jgi:hypothetical protein
VFTTLRVTMTHRHPSGRRWPLNALAALLCCTAATAALAEGGKLLLTGGVSTIDGAGGGGLVPWAVTSSYASAEQWGATAFATRVRTRDYGLTVRGAAATLNDRVEVSFARQDFDTGQNLAPLGLGGLRIQQDVLGLKLKVAGNAVLDADIWMPQLAVGALYKRTDAGALGATLTGALGARLSDTELYAAATKLFLAQGVLVNAVLRVTRANQDGLLGFGSAGDQRRHIKPELSVAYLLSRRLAVGAEYKPKPDNLNRSALGDGALREDAWGDVFVAWAPNKHFSLTAAWVDLGHIAPAVQPRRQSGAYLSAQLAL